MDSTFQSRTGQWLRLQRRLAGLTLNDLAKRLGCSYQQLQKYESGTNALPLERLARLLGALQLDPGAALVLLHQDAVPTLTQPSAALRSLHKYFSHLAEHEQRALVACARELARSA